MNSTPADNGTSFSSKRGNPKLAALTLAALGVVYGDIGTSPLYAFKEAFSGSHGLPLNEANVLAVLSVMFLSRLLRGRRGSARGSHGRSRSPVYSARRCSTATRC